MSQSDFINPVSNKSLLRQGDTLSYIYKGLIFIFILSALFDPAYHMFGLKVPVFLACWGVGWLIVLMRYRSAAIPLNLLIYVLLMLIIPLASILNYFISGGGQPFEGFLLLKSYFLPSFAILLYVTRVDALKYLTFGLTIMALLIVIISIIIFINPEMFMPFYHLGMDTKIFSLDTRDYGDGKIYFQIYFVVSSMLVIPIAYYFDKWHSLKSKRTFYFILLALCIFAMFKSGTRNNMIISILLPSILLFYYSRYRVIATILLILVIGIFVGVFSENIIVFFDPSEPSNSYKLAFLKDYFRIFNEFSFSNVLFGQGLGSYETWSLRGDKFITELTYFEVFRNFGLLMGLVMLILMIYPIIYTFIIRPSYKDKHIIIAYAAYLVMTMTNPLFFSSMGMLILAIILANISISNSDFKKSHLSMFQTKQKY